MADNFGLKIGVEGEKEFKNALRDINQSLKVLGSEMKLVESQFDRQDKSIEAVTARNQLLNKEMDAQKDKIKALEKALDNAATSFGENDRRTQNWAIQLNNAKAHLNGLEHEIKQNEKALTEIGDEFDDAEKQAEQFGKSLHDTANKAESSGGKFSALGGTLKGIGIAMGTAFVAVGAAAVSSAKSLTDMTVGAAAYADEILTTATVAGVSAESLQAYKYAAELVDVSMETLTGSMAKQIRSMSSARDGSADMIEAYDRLGISVANADGSLRNGEDVYWETIDALGKMEEGAERDALAMKIFGKSAQELNPLIAQGSAGIAELTDEAKRMGAVLSDETLAQLGKFDDSVQRLKSGSDAAKNALGTVLLPQLQIMAEECVALLGDFTKGLQDAGGDFTKISQVIGSTVGGIADMVLSNMPAVVQVGMDIVGAVGSSLLANLPMLFDTANQLIFTLLEGLISALPQLTDGALQLVLALTQGILDNLPAILESAMVMVATLITGIAEALPELVPKIVECVILMAQTLMDNAGLLIEAALALITGLAQGLINALPIFIEALPQLINSFINYFVNNLPLIIETGINLIIALVTGLIAAIPTLIAALPEIIIALVSGLGQAAEAIYDVGINIVKGLWDGIMSMGQWLSDKVTGFFGGVTDGVRNLLGMHSPSTVYADIGENMGAGVGIGFVRKMAMVTRDMLGAIPTTLDVSTQSNGLTGRTSSTNRDSGLLDGGSATPIYIYTTVELDKKAVGHSITPIVSRDLAFSLRGGKI
ncbi:MAG: phage tail protein [Acetobacterium sp. MES1]|uniref:phage tail protein n=1 Tax=Acetobacterium sp. MES1 TaxID=1899015 RepID=UPI000B9CBA70|nr:phage tail protein [Acetobacterium sp. MES1]OXS26605.1 MAG: phage tail protein [Acetobacterium sp. MES1]